MPKTDCLFDPLPDNLVALRRVTESADFSETLRHVGTPEIKEFVTEDGSSYMVGLFKNDNIAVGRVFSSAGTRFKKHSHIQWELIVVYFGELRLTVGGKEKILKEKDFYYVNPGVLHTGFYPTDSWVLAITIPASPDFPAGG